ncbi:MAG: sigma-54-dependent Fis family transcriptional regulator [Deltaproteobacteria bacterium]|nr:MAG: sigma-54-dependent Fis family transcriptional regulator [Deltaproteobacteria bacterium]
MSNTIIIIDDEKDFLGSVRRGLFTAGFKNVRLESNPLDAAALFRSGEMFDLALIDISMPGMSGVELLEVIKNESPATECIMVSALNEASVAVDCLKKGAYDYLVKPISREELLLTMGRALERKRLLDILTLEKTKTRPRLAYPKAFKSIITSSSYVQKILREAELHAASSVPVLITGESGTGKELLARAIHEASPRAKYSFTAVNMASVTPTLFDAEFFGHTKGAFTGAEKDRKGHLEQAHQGTLFLDEIGTLPVELQGKLLRVFQEGEYLKLGTSIPRKVDVRFIAATNTDLDQLMGRGKFRKDLYYRLRGAWLHLPPLRDREGDIPVLINHFLKEFGRPDGHCSVAEGALSLLLDYPYPGNIRELRSIIQSALNLAGKNGITAAVLPEYLRKRKLGAPHRTPVRRENIAPLWQVEKEHILFVYKQTGRNKSQSARLLGIGLNTLRRKLAAYGEG